MRDACLILPPPNCCEEEPDGLGGTLRLNAVAAAVLVGVTAATPLLERAARYTVGLGIGLFAAVSGEDNRRL